MGEVIHYQEIKKSRKEHYCWWCGEDICKGAAYTRWRWVDEDGSCVIKVHPECNTAWRAKSPEFGETHYVTDCGEHERGCPCERGFCCCKVTDADAKGLADSIFNCSPEQSGLGFGH